MSRAVAVDGMHGSSVPAGPLSGHWTMVVALPSVRR